MSDLPIHTGPEEVHVHPVHTGRRGLDLVLAVSAISISVISLGVAVTNEHTQRELVSANSWPFPVVGMSFDKEPHRGELATLRIINAGIGPARVQWVRLRLDGRIIRGKADFLKACCGIGRSKVSSALQHSLEGSAVIQGIIPAGQQTTFMVWRKTKENASFWPALKSAASRTVYDACYCSALDQCWTSHLSTTGNPVETGVCGRPEDAYQE